MGIRHRVFAEASARVKTIVAASVHVDGNGYYHDDNDRNDDQIDPHDFPREDAFDSIL